MRSRHEPARAGEGRPEPAGAGQIVQIDEIDEIDKIGESRGAELGAENQHHLKGRWPSPVIFVMLGMMEFGCLRNSGIRNSARCL